MKYKYKITEWDNGAREVLDTISLERKITYTTGDVVYFRGYMVVAILPHDSNGIRWRNCENPSTALIDSVSFPHKINDAVVQEHRKTTADVAISARKSSVGFDITIHVSRNPALQDAAMLALDTLLFNEENLSWLMSIHPWGFNYEAGVSYRYFSGDTRPAQDVLQKWFKICEQKIGKKNLSVESLMKA